MAGTVRETECQKADSLISTKSFLPFALPDIGEDDIAEVVDSLRSGWITTGPKTKRFEQQFVEYLGGGLHAVAVNSATAGLHLALEACGIGPGDEVITTVHTFTATAEIIRYLGADPKFVDMDRSTFCIDVDAFEAAITPKTKAVIPVHYGGLAADMPRILEIAKRHGLRVIEDAAHAIPTTIGGRMIGTLESDATIFSFYATKTLATGEGGMLVTRDAALAKRAQVMRLHGIDRDAFDRYTSSKPGWAYDVIAPGFKYNMTDVAASLGIHQLAKADRFHARRSEIANRYNREMKDLPLRLPPVARPGDLHAWHLYVICLTDDCAVSRDEAIQRLFDEGIGVSVHYIPLHMQTYWRERYDLLPENFPVSTTDWQQMISLPIYTKMTDHDQTRVIQALNELFGN